MSVLLVVREPEYRHDLELLGLKFAGSRNVKLYVLALSEGEGMPEIEWQEGEVKVEAEISCVNAKNMVLGAVKELNPSLVILHDAPDHPKHFQETVNGVMEEVSCEVLVMRLGSGGSSGGDDLGSVKLRSEKVLVPCSGGRNSRVALQLAAHAMIDQTTAFFVEPDVDEVSESVGFAHLHRYVQRAGLSVEDVRCHVALDSDVFHGIRTEMEKGDYGMLLIGAARYSSVRKKLYGVLPERLLKEGVSLGVVRAARPMGHRLRDSFERLLQLKVPQLNRKERILLFDEIEEKSRWSFDFAALMILATSIASLGLLADSAAVVIGAMLVAPLMMPLLGGGLALIQRNSPLWKRSMSAVLLGFFSALLIGFLLGLGARWLGMPLTSELLARGKPSLLDLGVALVSGMAASYCLARPKLSGALAGVAIAAALVPPIATTGICLAMGAYEVSRGAALLFGLNVVAIVVGASLNFYLAGIRGKTNIGKWSQQLSLFLAIAMLGLAVTFSFGLWDKFSQTAELKDTLKDSLSHDGVEVTDVKKGRYEDGLLEITVYTESAVPLSDDTVDEMKRKIQNKLEKKIKLKVRTILVKER